MAESARVKAAHKNICTLFFAGFVGAVCLPAADAAGGAGLSRCRACREAVLPGCIGFAKCFGDAGMRDVAGVDVQAIS